MQTATNPQTGERVYLDEAEGAWKPLVTATNPETGQQVYLRGEAWEPLGAPETQAEPERRRGPLEVGFDALEGAGQALFDDLPNVPGAVATAVRNVPENLKLGFKGVQLSGAELGALQDYVGQVAALDDQIAELNTALDVAKTGPDRGRAREIFNEIERLTFSRDELARLGGGANEATLTPAPVDPQAAAAEVPRIWAEMRGIQAELEQIPAEPGTPAWYLAMGIGSAAEMAPGLLASMATANPLPAMGYMGFYTYGRSYGEARERGLDPETARNYALLSAIAEGIPEYLPVSVLIKPGSRALTRVFSGAGAEAVQETFTEALQIGLDRGYLEPGMSWDEAKQRLIDAGIIGSIAGGGLGATATTTEAAARQTAQIAEDIASRLQSVQTGQRPQPEIPAEEQSVDAPREAPQAPVEPDQTEPELPPESAGEGAGEAQGVDQPTITEQPAEPETEAAQPQDEGLPEAEVIEESGSSQVETDVNEPVDDSVLGHAKLFGESSHAQTLKSSSLKSVEVDGQHVILSQVLRAIDDPQILNAVVETIPVDMVDVLAGREGAANMLLDNPAMLREWLSVPGDEAIPEPVIGVIDALSSATKGTLATPVTEDVSLGSGSFPVDLSGNDAPAVGTASSDRGQSENPSENTEASSNPALDSTQESTTDTPPAPVTQAGSEPTATPTPKGASSARMVDIKSQVNELLADAKRLPANEKRAVKLGVVRKELAERVEAAIGTNVEGFEHSIDTFAIRHILKRHGDADVEASRGQLAVTEDDIAKIPEIIANPVRIVTGLQTRGRKDAIGYVYQEPNGNLLYLEEIRTGRRTLSAVTMRKFASTTDVPGMLPRSGPNALDDADTVSDTSEADQMQERSITATERKVAELSRKTALERLRKAEQELRRKIKAGDHTFVELTVKAPDGKSAKYTFLPNEQGLDRIKSIRQQWKKGSSESLFLDPPDPMGAAAVFDGPMPNWQPLMQSLPAPTVLPSRQIDVAGEIIDLPAEHKPMRRDGIRLRLEKMIGQRFYQGKIKGKSALGFYRRSNGEVRIRKFDDLEVMAHEIAHWLDFHSSRKKVFNTMRRKAPPKALEQMKALSYTSNPQQVNKEGFAEFVRLWLTQYDVAAAQAPDFLEIFERTLAQDKTLNRQMRRIRRDMHIYYSQGALAQFRAKMGQDDSPAAVMQRFMASRPIEKFRAQVIDRVHAIKVAEREVMGEVQSGAASAYKLMQMVNGAGSVYDTVIEDGTIRLASDGSFERVGPGLNEVLKPVADLGAKAFDEFLQYAAARRAQELMGQQRENLFTADEIRASLALERPEFRQAFDAFQTFNRQMLDFYVQMGLITNDQRIAFEQNNQAYVPFHRVSESLETGKASGSSIGKRLTGGDRNINDVAENITNNLMTNIRAAMTARAKRRLYQMLKSNDRGGQFAVKIGPDSKKVKAHVEDLAKSVAATMASLGFGVSSNGLIVANPGADTYTDVADIEQVLIERPELLQFWQHNQRPRTKDTFVDSVIMGDRIEYFEVNDPALVDALETAELRNLGMAMSIVRGVKRGFTAAITSMPPFFLPNAVRDTVTAGALSDSGFRPVVDTLRGMGHIIARSDQYKEWMRQGGGYSSLVQQSIWGSKGKAKLIEPPGLHPTRIMAKALAAYSEIPSAFENGSRVGEYLRALDSGASRTEAAYRSRDISNDYSRRGSDDGLWSLALQSTPFMNAALQGNDRLMRAFLGENTGAKAQAHAAITRLMNPVNMGIVAFTSILWALQNDDERYEELTPDQKARFWHIFLPGQERALQIPKPYGVGFIFGDTTENLLDFVKAEQGEDVARNLAFSAWHHFWFADYPAIMQPTIEAWKNETFTGAPIIPFDLENVSARYQYRPNTPEVYKRAGETLNVSPLMLQHYSRGFLGYVELAVADLTELMLWDRAAFGERPFPKGPEDYFLRQFRGPKYPYRTKWTEGYYELRQRARTAAADLSLAEKRAHTSPSVIGEIASDPVSLALASLNRQFTKIDRQLSQGRKGLDATVYDPRLTRAEKESRIEDWYRRKNELLGGTFKAIEAEIKALEEQRQ